MSSSQIEENHGIMGLRNLLLSQDKLGHSIGVNYKGNEKFSTLLGAALSILITIMVLVQFLQKSIALVEMSEPTIQTYDRPIYPSEQEQFGEILLKDYQFNAGIAISGPTWD